MAPAAAESAERQRAREAARRRRAVGELRIAEAVAGYTAGRVGNGLGPEEARQAVAEAASALHLIAAGLARLARPDVAERRELAAELSAAGLRTREVAAVVGVSPRTVRGYLRAAR